VPHCNTRPIQRDYRQRHVQSVAIDSFVFVQKADNTQKLNYGAQKFYDPLFRRHVFEVKKQLVPLNVAVQTSECLLESTFLLTFVFPSVLPLLTTTTTARMSSPRSGSPTLPSPRPDTPCSENNIDQPMSPISQSSLSSPTPSDAADCATSNSNGTGSYYSRAPTPQCIPLEDDIIIPENVSSLIMGPTNSHAWVAD
jgi:hypothetical protein